jgi:hypothetical protein
MKQKTKITNNALIGLASFLALSGCTLVKDPAAPKNNVAQIEGTGNPADQKGIAGVPGAAVPTTNAIIGRIQNGLKRRALATQGIWRVVVDNQIGNSLPENTNPLLATGYELIPLMAYAACTDVNMLAYGIQGASITIAKPALVAAGVNIVDQHTGGLGSTGPKAAAVAALFGKLVDDNAKIPGETVNMAWVSVCMAANVFGTNMLGF